MFLIADAISTMMVAGMLWAVFVDTTEAKKDHR